jgi:signal transduction histidine kinase
MWAETEPGKGSTLYFTIPKHPESIESIKSTAKTT